MMLGLSNNENETDFAIVTEGADCHTSGVAGEREMIAFADTVIGRDDEQIAATRSALDEVLPAGGALEVASVVAHFDAINRVADAAGVSLDSNMVKFGGPVIDALGMQ